MFLNDAFDIEFDQQFRTERPIPSGAISLAAVWRWGLLLLGLGGVCLISLGPRTGVLGVVLVFFIVVAQFVSARYLLLGLPAIYLIVFRESRRSDLVATLVPTLRRPPAPPRSPNPIAAIRPAGSGASLRVPGRTGAGRLRRRRPATPPPRSRRRRPTAA